MLINVMTPTVLFKSICLLMSAYILRFTRLSRLIRNFCVIIKEENTSYTESVKKQIGIFSKRIKIIKYIHSFGVLSLICTISAMCFVLLEKALFASIFFAAGLIFFLGALLTVLVEIYFSLKALDINSNINY